MRGIRLLSCHEGWRERLSSASRPLAWANGIRPPVSTGRSGSGSRSGAGGEPLRVDDLDRAVADPDQAAAFQVLEHLVQRWTLNAEHGGQGSLGQFHPSVDRLLV